MNSVDFRITLCFSHHFNVLCTQIGGKAYFLEDIYGLRGSTASAPASSVPGDGGKASGSVTPSASDAGATSGGGGGLSAVPIDDSAVCVNCLTDARDTVVLPCR